MNLLKGIFNIIINPVFSFGYIYEISILLSIPLNIIGFLLDKSKDKPQIYATFGGNKILDSVLCGAVIGVVPGINILCSILNVFEIRSFIKTRKFEKEKRIREKYYSYVDKLNEIQATLNETICRNNSNLINNLTLVITKYKKIIRQELYRDMVANRVEYIIILLEECINDKSLGDNADKILEMLQITGDFFDEILQQINDKEKAIMDSKNVYIREQMIKFNETTKTMKEGLKDIRKAEKLNKTK